jgi:hypothetical protein
MINRSLTSLRECKTEGFSQMEVNHAAVYG